MASLLASGAEKLKRAALLLVLFATSAFSAGCSSASSSASESRDASTGGAASNTDGSSAATGGRSSGTGGAGLATGGSSTVGAGGTVSGSGGGAGTGGERESGAPSGGDGAVDDSGDPPFAVTSSVRSRLAIRDGSRRRTTAPASVRPGGTRHRIGTRQPRPTLGSSPGPT